jgi:hypothetical protein
MQRNQHTHGFTNSKAALNGDRELLECGSSSPLSLKARLVAPTKAMTSQRQDNAGVDIGG